MKLRKMAFNYRELSPYANFISANFNTAISQNFPKIFGLCVLRAIYFITAIFIPSWLMRFWGDSFHYCDFWTKIADLPNVNFG